MKKHILSSLRFSIAAVIFILTVSCSNTGAIISPTIIDFDILTETLSNIHVGDSFSLDYSEHFDGSLIEISSSDDSVIHVNGDSVTAAGPGVATITATLTDGSGADSAEITVYPAEFIMVWTIPSDNLDLTIPVYDVIGYTDFPYNYSIDWGDGTTDSWDGGTDSYHTYLFEGKYTVKISGVFSGAYWPGDGNETRTVDIVNWGNIPFQSLYNSFSGMSGLIMSAKDIPDLSRVTSIEQAFMGCTSFNGDVSRWDTTTVTDMDYVFALTAFNQSIGNWNTSNVTSMSGMFYSASDFNQDITQLDTSKVKDMNFMFYGAASFNQNLSGWDVSNVVNYDDFATDSGLTADHLPDFISIQ